ncbi:MAG TPA: hypothetical protein ENJ60_07415, partial [Aeromonadales bacterium]|nr:hypothetical protein [Aeromonadales bacterium]
MGKISPSKALHKITCCSSVSSARTRCYTLFGHSHRSALYQQEGEASSIKDTLLLRDNRLVSGQTARIQGNKQCFSPKPEDCRILVAASGGPIPVQNHNYEFFNWGLDIPSGNY